MGLRAASGDEQRRPLTERHHAARDVVRVEDGVILVDERGVRERVRSQVGLGPFWSLGRDRQHLRSEGGEAFVVVAQLREVPAAERSGVAAEEREHDRPTAERRQ